MNHRIFQYALPAPPLLEDLNAYLGTQRVASVAQHVVPAAGGTMLMFVVQTVGTVDDVLVFGTREELREVRDRAEMVLDGLGLNIKDDGVLNRVALGVPFLGFTLYPDRTRLNRGGRKRLRRRTREIERAQERDEIGGAELQARGEALFAHARGGDDVAWRRAMLRFSRFELGEAPAPATRDARRLVEKPGLELPLGLSQQEASRQPQQESGLPPLLGPRHGGSLPPDDAPSRARLNRDETTESPPCADIPAEGGAEKACGGAGGATRGQQGGSR